MPRPPPTSREAYVRALAWLFGLVDLERQPRTPGTMAQMSVERVRSLLDRLGRPEEAYPSILVAGSKGKGSTAVMLANILQAAGHLTGLYTQPHLHTYRERIRIDGEPISESDLASQVARVAPHVQALAREVPEQAKCTTFETVTALALDYFARAEIEIAVLEVGLGGRLDATNVVEACLSTITPISYEHMAVLGDTLAKIAFEKAGIIKAGRPVLSAAQAREAEQVIAKRAEELGAPIGASAKDWNAAGSTNNFAVSADHACPGLWAQPWTHDALEISLLGEHQIENAALAVAAAEVVRQTIGMRVGQSAVAEGLKAARWEGRIEVIRGLGPNIVVDGAHNGDSAEKLAAALRANFSFDRVWLVFGVLQDKDIAAILRPLAPITTHVWTCKTRHRRSREAEDTATACRELGMAATPAQTCKHALNQALNAAGPGDLIVVTGSLSTAAEAREALGLVPPEGIDPL